MNDESQEGFWLASQQTAKLFYKTADGKQLTGTQGATLCEIWSMMEAIGVRLVVIPPQPIPIPDDMLNAMPPEIRDHMLGVRTLRREP